MINSTKSLYPNDEWSCIDILNDSFHGQYDYVVYNGILTQKLNVSHKLMDRYAHELIKKMFNLSCWYRLQCHDNSSIFKSIILLSKSGWCNGAWASCHRKLNWSFILYTNTFICIKWIIMTWTLISNLSSNAFTDAPWWLQKRLDRYSRQAITLKTCGYLKYLHTWLRIVSVGIRKMPVMSVFPHWIVIINHLAFRIKRSVIMYWKMMTGFVFFYRLVNKSCLVRLHKYTSLALFACVYGFNSAAGRWKRSGLLGLLLHGDGSADGGELVAQVVGWSI